MNLSRRMEATLVEEELISSVAWFIRIRWLAGLGVLAATWFITTILNLSLPAVVLYSIGAAILAYNAVFNIILGLLQRVEPYPISVFDGLTKVQTVLDWLMMTLLIHFSGGIESPAILFFLFHIIIASILLSPRVTYLYAALATVLLGGTATLEYAGMVPHVRVFEFGDAAPYRNTAYVVGMLVFFASTVFVAAYLGATLSSRLRKREAEVVELSESLRRAYSRLQTLYEHAKTVSSTLELQQVLDQLVRSTAETMDVRACSIRLLDETGARLYVAAVHGLSEAYVKKGDLILERNPLAREVLAGKPIAVGDIMTETRLQYPAEAIAEGIRSMLSVPLIGKRGALGLIRAYSTELNHFTADDVQFLTAIASQGSIAIENALAYQALGKLDQMKSKFVRMVTHELRSPVSVIRSLLRTMTAGYTGTLTDLQRDLVTRVSHRADFLQTLIDDLLDLAAGKSDLGLVEEREVVALGEAVERVIKRFEVMAQGKQIRLEWRCEDGAAPLTIKATNAGVDRIVTNLVSNAIKYTPQGGRVSVLLRRAENEAELQVADSGIGIPENALPHLFEEFYRAPNAKAIEKEGTGLGLAITKDLVTRYGGRLAVQSQVGQGTTFTVRLPLAQDAGQR